MCLLICMGAQVALSSYWHPENARQKDPLSFSDSHLCPHVWPDGRFGLITFLTLLLHGGIDLVVLFWSTDGKGYEGMIKWPVLLFGIPLGGITGIFLWYQVGKR